MRRIIALQFPGVPGGNVPGIVEKIGENVAGLKAGDAVFGYNMIGGTYAERIAVDAAALALRPAALSVERAAAVAVVG